MTTTARRTLMGLCMAMTVFALLAVAQEMPRTTTQQIKGTSAVQTRELSGTVVTADSDTLVVRLSNGELQTFNPKPTTKFIIDGQETPFSQLKPGTTLHAKETVTTTPVTDRTTTVGTGKVWFVSGNTVILTLPNNENRMYKVKEDYRFIINGQKASVHELKKGMVVSAEKIVESPRAEIAVNAVVTGEAPPPPRTVASAPPPLRPTPTPAAAPAPAPAPKPAAAPAPTPAPVEQAENTPPKLPKTGSPLPLIGMLGLLFTGASSVMRILRRS